MANEGVISSTVPVTAALKATSGLNRIISTVPMLVTLFGTSGTLDIAAGTIYDIVPLDTSIKAESGLNQIAAVVEPFTVGTIFKTAVPSAKAPDSTRQRYPAVPTDFLSVDTDEANVKVLLALRERVEIFSRDRGRTEDSFVRVEDLIALGLIKPEDLEKLSIR